MVRLDETICPSFCVCLNVHRCIAPSADSQRIGAVLLPCYAGPLLMGNRYIDRRCLYETWGETQRDEGVPFVMGRQCVFCVWMPANRL